MPSPNPSWPACMQCGTALDAADLKPPTPRRIVCKACHVAASEYPVVIVGDSEGGPVMTPDMICDAAPATNTGKGVGE